MLVVKSLTYIEDEFWQLKDICWSGAIDVLNMIEEKGLEDEAIQVIHAYFDEEKEITDTTLNDFIWFELEDVMKEWGYLQEDEEEGEEE